MPAARGREAAARAAWRQLAALLVLSCTALATWAALAIDEGKKNGWTVAAGVVDPGGTLVYFERIDGTQNGSSEVAIAKARSAAAFERPTKVFEDAVAGGRTAIVTLSGALPIEGGLPIVDAGKIVGAIGVSGATSQRDGVCA